MAAGGALDCGPLRRLRCSPARLGARYSRQCASMEEKARSNLKAAEVLVNAQLFDSAASRAYYAAYLAGWSWLAANNQEPPPDADGRRYWRHASFPERLFEWGALHDPDQRDDFEFLRSRRVQADYYVDPINSDEAEEALGLATALVGQLLGEDSP